MIQKDKDFGRHKLWEALETISTCYHEAGHIITQLHSFFITSKVTLSTSAEALSFYDHFITDYYSLFTNDQNLLYKAIYNEIKIYYAGCLAEELFFKNTTGSRKIPRCIKRTSWQDYQVATDIIKKNKMCPNDQRSAFKKQIIEEVEELLNSFYSDLELLAKKLYTQKNLNFSQIKSTLLKESVNYKFWEEHFKKLKSIHPTKDSINFSKLKKYLP